MKIQASEGFCVCWEWLRKAIMSVLWFFVL